MANFVSAETVKRLETPEALGSGKDVYTKNCVACHGPQGEGTVGPNLTDDFWIHGGGIKNIFLTVTNGVPAKGMISWKSQLTPKQIQEVSSYIMSLHGSKPANGKEPQGDKWVEAGTSAPAATDSTTVVKDSSAVSTAAN
ncbi:MAG: c-type cytochrome [Bacteroidia bacterium]|nr:c-type cytochrome [Bacteroidia bacterium]